MKKVFFSLLFLGFLLQANAQFGQESTDTAWKQEFRASSPITFNIKHTKLEVNFDFNKSYLYGKEWLTVMPHFYATGLSLCPFQIAEYGTQFGHYPTR